MERRNEIGRRLQQAAGVNLKLAEVACVCVREILADRENVFLCVKRRLGRVLIRIIEISRL